MFQAVSDDIHEQFIEDVAKGRGMDIGTVRKLADGSIMSGRQALKVGLVDSLGNFRDAVHKTAQLAGIMGEPTLVWPKDPNRSLLGELIGSQVRALARAFREELSAGAGTPLPAYLYQPFQN